MTVATTALARLRSILALGLLCLGLAACGESVELISRVSETEANQILSTLLGAGIEAQKAPGEEGTVTVMVNGRRVADALQIMRANGLPKEQFVRMGDVFKKDGLISSPLEERARYIYALSQELAETVSSIDGVITARVHVVLPDRTPGTAEAMVPSSAAVFIKYKEAYDLERVVPQIKRLVTNSISNLNYDNVSVVLVPSMAVTPSQSNVKAASASFLGMGVAADSVKPLSILVGILGVLAVAGLGGAGAMFWLWKIRPKRDGGDHGQA
ncbi:MAG TPA: type III secretion inner membrane ring lipoprotein SctJ [Magnetospirillum sp.]|nr:type III secretion inner membrane ring lipoprotein SctJ [Magnetospirillum sp.]